MMEKDSKLSLHKVKQAILIVFHAREILIPGDKTSVNQAGLLAFINNVSHRLTPQYTQAWLAFRYMRQLTPHIYCGMMHVLGPSDKSTHALASYIVLSDGYENMRDITSNCKGFLPTKQS